MIDEREVEKGLQWCVDNAGNAGQVKSNFVHLDRFTKVIRAKLMHQSKEKTVSAQENYAYAHPEMLEHLEGLREAEKQWEEIRWKRDSIMAKSEAWRTQCSNTRALR
jgi:hypothetical protein